MRKIGLFKKTIVAVLTASCVLALPFSAGAADVRERLADDFNRSELYGFDIQSDNIASISAIGAEIVDEALKITSTADKPAMYATTIELDNNDYKYLALKIKGAKGGEGTQFSLLNEKFEGNAVTNKKYFSTYTDTAITTGWQYVYIDLAANGFKFHENSEGMNTTMPNGWDGKYCADIMLMFDAVDATIYVDDIAFLTEMPEADYMIGDVNADGQVTAVDALLALNVAAGKVDATDYIKVTADVNFDGDITASDALRILNYAAGKITSF